MYYASFSADYVESISPLDRNLYWAYWLQEQKEQKEPDRYNMLDNNIPAGINMHGLT